MTSKVTQCPECKTSFRVTEAQLAIANGAVRCGSCLHIFNAGEHWLQPAAPAIDEPELDSLLEQHASELDDIFSDEDDDLLMGDTIQQKSMRNILEEDDNFQISDDLEIDDETEVNEEEQSRIEESLLAELDEEDELLFNDTVQQKAISLIEKDDDESLLDEIDGYMDESPADDEATTDSFKDTRTGLIIDSGMISADDLHLADGETGDQELSDTFLDLDSWQEEGAVFKDLDNLGDGDKDADSWAEKLLEDDDDIEKEDAEEDPLDDLEDEVPSQPKEYPLDPDLLNILDDSPAQAQEDEFILGDEPMLAGERVGSDNISLLANIEPEPVEMSWQEQSSRKKKNLWIAAAVLALLCLAVQYLVFNFDSLARNADYRPTLASLCKLTGCQLPGINDASLIRSTNLMVRSSSTRKNTLVVDVIITNRAKFQQAFPILDLVFTDLSGKVIASRQFKPETYLAGELTGSTQMPIMQPVHIALEIVDPGEQAVNYQLNLLANTNIPPAAE
jgi:predicted Zn finger-like uncharacterized protein